LCGKRSKHPNQARTKKKKKKRNKRKRIQIEIEVDNLEKIDQKASLNFL
jgi:hypothetical protein